MNEHPNVTLQTGSLLHCPLCERDQLDPVEDYTSPAQTVAKDHCEYCAIDLVITSLPAGSFKVEAVYSSPTAGVSHAS